MNIAWIAFTLMVTVAAVGITIPLVRRYDSKRAPATPPQNEILTRQLAEIEGQAAAGAAPDDVIESLKAETVRRFLAETPAAEPAARPISARTLLVLGVGLAGMIAVGGTLLYTKIGRPDLATQSASSTPADGDQAAAGGGANGAPPGHVGNMIAELEGKLRQTPNDPEGWRMLGWSYMQTNRFADAAGAYGRAASLDPANADYKSAQGEALVKAADGHVTTDAEAAFAAAVKLDPTDPRARYFLAAAKDQRGDHDGAMNDWIALLKSAPPGAPWAPEVRGFVIRIAQSRGQDISSRLPPPPPPAPGGDAQAAAGPDPSAAGPSPDQVAAAQQMAPADQQAMIHGMVDKLAARLKANPKDADGWVNLMRARMVLNDPKAATDAYHQAMKTFAGAPEQTMLSQAAKQMGVPGA